MATRSKKYSVGIGTTGNCNLNCHHCYSSPFRGKSLSFEQIASFINTRKFASLNFGTGENILNPDFLRIVRFCHEKGIKISYTSNGYGVINMPDEVLRMFHDIDLSLDFPTKRLQNDFRGGRAWEFVDKAISKCRANGLTFSIAATMMSCNYKYLPLLLQRAGDIGAFLRLNIFKHTAGTPDFSLSYDAFWTAIQSLFESGTCLSCSEPMLNALLQLPVPGQDSGCGSASMRIHPDGSVVPCVYITQSDVSMTDLSDGFAPIHKSDVFLKMKVVPDFCTNNCEYVKICSGGCASRRLLTNGIQHPDIYCPIPRDAKIPKLAVVSTDEPADLVHASYLCTLIFKND